MPPSPAHPVYTPEKGADARAACDLLDDIEQMLVVQKEVQQRQRGVVAHTLLDANAFMRPVVKGGIADSSLNSLQQIGVEELRQSEGLIPFEGIGHLGTDLGRLRRDQRPARELHHDARL